MIDRVKTTARRGLRLRRSPRDGETISVLPAHTSLEVLDQETWLKVRTPDGVLGFVSGDFVEPASPEETEGDHTAPAEIIDYISEGSILRSAGPIRIDRDFKAALEEIERLAIEQGLRLFVTSSLRRPGQPISNAVVNPALVSNHYVGHGIDMNVDLKGRRYNSAALGEFASLPEPVQAFLTKVNGNAELRWGGEFSTPDPVHIDDGLNLREGRIYREFPSERNDILPKPRTTFCSGFLSCVSRDPEPSRLASDEQILTSRRW